MSDIETILRSAQDNVTASTDVDEYWGWDSKDEPGDNKFAEDAAADQLVNEEQGESSPISPAHALTDAEWEEVLRAQREEYGCGEYSPPNDDVMVFETTDIDTLLATKEVEYVEKPFVELHHLYNYLLISLEDSCREYAMRCFGEKMTDRSWLIVKLDLGPDHNTRFSMADKQWAAPGQIEIGGWVFFIERLGLPEGINKLRDKLFPALNKLRQAAIHRWHWRLSKENLEIAMLLPDILGDERCASEMKQVYTAFLQDPAALDAETKVFLHASLCTQKSAPVLIPELLGRIQTLLENSAFAYAKKVDPTFLREYNFEVSEQVELQEYWRRWTESGSQVRQHPESLTEYPDPYGTGGGFRETLYNIKELRNQAVHRLHNADPEISTADSIRKTVEWAKTFAVMVGDSKTAEEIELIFSTWVAAYRPALNAA